MEELRDLLIRYQDEHGLSNAEMGRLIGVPEPTWCRIRNRQRGIGSRTLLRILQRFPEFGPLFLVSVNRAIGTDDRADRRHTEPTRRAGRRRAESAHVR